MPKSFTEIFERDFPYYLSIGMTYDLYWYGDVWLVKAYREAHKLRMKQINANAHLQGMYFYEALLDASPVFHDFAQKGTKPIAYRSEPYDLYGEKKQEKRKIDKKQERLLAKIYLNTLMRNMQRGFEARNGTAKQSAAPEATSDTGKTNE